MRGIIVTTVLVLSNHTDVLEQALAARGHDVIAVMTRPAYQLRHHDGHRPPYPTRAVDSWQSFDAIARIGYEFRGRIDRIATTWEGAIVAAGFLRDRLGVPGMNMHTAVGVTDKAVMKDRLAAGGIPVARHRYVRTPADVYTAAAAGLGWPIIVKPLGGFGSTNTHSIDTPADLKAAEQRLFYTRLGSAPFFHAEPAFRALNDQHGFIAEQDLDPRFEYHIDQLWADGEPLYSIVGRYNTPPLQGMGTALGSVLLPHGSNDAIRLADLAHRAVRTLSVTSGFTHTEILQDRFGRPYVGEVAARPGGGGIQRTLFHAYGIDVPALLAADAAGQDLAVDVEPRPGAYGWIGPYAPDGRIREIAHPSAILRHPGVLEATVVAKPGDPGGMTGSTLWAGAVGHAYLTADTIDGVLALMPDVADAYSIVVDQPLPVGR